MTEAPRNLDVTIVKLPPVGPAAHLPPLLKMLWADSNEVDAKAAFAPLLAVDGVGQAKIDVVPYGSVLLDPPSPPGPAPRSTQFAPVFPKLSDQHVDRAVQALAALPMSMFEVRFLGGALADYATDETAIAWRDAEVFVHWMAMLPPGSSDADLARAHATWKQVLDGSESVYGPFTEDSGPEIVARMYPPDTLARLRVVKKEWDPNNLFRRNHNIMPAGDR